MNKTILFSSLLVAGFLTLAGGYFFLSHVSSPVIVTSSTTTTSTSYLSSQTGETSGTTTQQFVLAITSASVNGVQCSISSPESATCDSVSIGVGAHYTLSITVSNTGGSDASVTASAGTTSGGGSVISVGSALPSSVQVIPPMGSASWDFVITGVTPGTDTVVVTLSA